MATIQPRTDQAEKTHYRVQVRLRGFPSLTKTFGRKTDAERWAQRTEADMRAGRDFPTPESNRHTVAELIGKYIANALPRKRLSTSRNQASQLEWWRERLGHYLLQELRPALLADAREGLSREPTPSGKPRSPSTVNRYMAAMSHCLTYAVRDLNWLDDNPMRKVSRNKEPQGVVRYLSDQERSRLLSVCKQSSSSFLYPIVLLALSTGMRRSEIMNLTWDRIDFLRDAITLRSADTKNAEVRIVPLKSHARGALAELWKDRLSDSALVFPAPTAPEGSSKSIDIESAWRSALKRAELKNFRFHDLRHSAASYLAMNRGSPLDIAAVLGHKTLQMVKRYAHLSETHTSAVVERMNVAIFDGSSCDGREPGRPEATDQGRTPR